LNEDNQAAIAMVKESWPTPCVHGHIDIQHFAIQEWRARGIIQLFHIPGVINAADQQQTKPLSFFSSLTPRSLFHGTLWFSLTVFHGVLWNPILSFLSLGRVSLHTIPALPRCRDVPYVKIWWRTTCTYYVANMTACKLYREKFRNT
jgi:hypothetical protein